MKLSVRHRWPLWLVVLCCWLQTAPAQTDRVVSKIEVGFVGPKIVSESLIRANIRVKEGESYTRLQVDNDVRNLYGTGYFYNIQVTEKAAAEGTGVILTYVVEGKPRLTGINFTGNNKYSAEKLLKKVTSRVGQPLDKRKLFLDAQEIVKYYQKAGFQGTKVEPVEVVDQQAGRGTVTFEIKESPKIRVDDVIFEGAQAFTQKKLRGAIKTRRHWMFSWLTGSGKLKDEQFEEDKEKLIDFYQEKGYIDFEIRDIKFEEPEPQRLVIRFLITEGRQYKVGAIDIKQNKLFTREQINMGMRRLHGWNGKKGAVGPNGFVMDVGTIFTPEGLSDARDAVQDFYGSQGHIDTRVGVIKTPNIETGTMDLTFQIDEGGKSFVEKVEIRGNTKTKDKVIRRELAISPGEIFDMVRVKISKQRLEGMNFFERPEATPEPTDVTDRKNLVITVQEKNTGNLALGAGLRSLDGAVGFVEMTQGNFDLFNPPYFTGAGQKFRLSLQIGTERQDYMMTFLEPWFLGRKLSFETSLYHRQLEYMSSLYNQQQTGARITLRRALGNENIIGGIGYTLENIGITDVSLAAPPSIKAEEGFRLVSKITGTLAYDTRNNAMMPSRGQRTELLAEIAGGPFGGETDIYKVELRTGWYFRGPFRGHILEVLGRVGVADGLNEAATVPLFDKFFLGGQMTLRGFDYPDVGPKEAGEPIGGNTYWFGSMEYSIPIIERLRFAMFYDAGMVYRDSYSFSPGIYNTGVYNSNWGIGIRLNLPIGPLRLDYGIPLVADRVNDNSGKFQFGVGFSRDY